MTNYTDNIGKATKDHISLETAKLLKDCGVENKWFFIDGGIYPSPINVNQEHDVAPAFTWQEILWEHAGKFFGEEIRARSVVICLLMKLFDRQYEEADEYFRKHCILIPQSTNE